MTICPVSIPGKWEPSLNVFMMLVPRPTAHFSWPTWKPRPRALLRNNLLGGPTFLPHMFIPSFPPPSAFLFLPLPPSRATHVLPGHWVLDVTFSRTRSPPSSGEILARVLNPTPWERVPKSVNSCSASRTFRGPDQNPIPRTLLWLQPVKLAHFPHSFSVQDLSSFTKPSMYSAGLCWV